MKKPPRPRLVDLPRTGLRALFRGLSHGTACLPEYDDPYRLIHTAPDAPIRTLLSASPLVRIPVPSDLRACVSLFSSIETRVTRTLHSQTPHIDIPHTPGDPRRYNLFWAESPRQGALTYFIPRRHAVTLSRLLAELLRSNTKIQDASAPVLRSYATAPESLSRYPLPAAVVEGYRALVFDGDSAGWDELTVFGQTTVCARVLGNTTAATWCVRHILSALGDAVHIECWDRPQVVLADDTAFFHGRLGMGETGSAFFRVWISGPPESMLRYVV